MNSTYFIPSSTLVVGHLINFRFSSLYVELFYFGFNLYPLITNEVKNPPFCLLGICMYSSVNCLFSAFADFSTALPFSFLTEVIKIYILDA